MNDDRFGGELHAWIEPEIEARMVAMILGEASAFEVDELERMMEERPELRVFKRRMEAVHGLLGEAVKPGDDEQWRLAPERRAAVMEALGIAPAKDEAVVVDFDGARERRVRRSGLRVAMMAAACLLITLLLAPLLMRGIKVGKSERGWMDTQNMSYPTSEESDMNVRGLGPEEGVVTLQPGFPPELMEGTPKPVHLTNRASGGGGGSVSDKLAALKESLGTEVAGPEQKTEGERYSRRASLSDGEQRLGEVSDGLSSARAVAANLPAPARVPVPAVTVPQDMADFSNDDFGDGFGVDSDGRAPAKKAETGLAENVERMKSQKVMGKLSVVPATPMARPAPPTKKENLHWSLEVQDLAEGIAGESNEDAPELGDVPMKGRLFSKSDGKDSLESRETEEKFKEGQEKFKPGKKGEVDEYYAKGLGKLKDLDAEEAPSASRPAPADAGGEMGGSAGGDDPFAADDGSFGTGVADHSPAELVRIKTKAVEVTQENGKELGFDWIVEDEAKKARTDALFVGGGTVGEGNGRTSEDFISPVAGVDIAGGSKLNFSLNGVVTGGLRSGDAAITRNSIDAILNNPKRGAVQKQEADAPPAITGTLNDGYESQHGQDESRSKHLVDLAKKRTVKKDLGAVAAGYVTDSDGDGAGIEVEGKAADGVDFSNKSAGRDLAAQTDNFSYMDRPETEESESGWGFREAEPASEPASGPVSIRERESLRRQGAVNAPEVALMEDRKNVMKAHLADESVALAQQHRRTGRYDEAKEVLESVLEEDPGNADARQGLAYLDDPIRTNPALSFEHTENVDKVRRDLYMGEGNYNLGKFDDAKTHFEEVLKTDPYNTAARRWMERISATESDYYRAAYDETRARLLTEVDKAWEMEVPPAPGSESVLTADQLERGAKVSELGKRDPDLLKNEKRKLQTQLETLRSKNDEAARKKAEEAKRLAEQKKQAALDEMEKSASEEAFSTFSLHVSDVSFKLAQAALAKGEWPDAGRVRVEEFVNAFDYGDPSPRQEDKVACALEQAAHPFMQQRNLLRVSMRTAAVGRASGTPLRLTVLLDNSGSMERADRAESVQRAFRLLADQMQGNDELTLISFARTPRLLRDSVPAAKAGELVDVIAQTPSEGGTNLELALQLGLEKATEDLLAGAQNRIILLTDGAANLGNAAPDDLAKLVEEMRQKGIAFDACGVGAEGLNDDVLEALTRKGDGRYYFLDRPEDADAGFAKQIAGALRPAAKNVKVQVEFNPKRVGNYRLYGFEKHELKKEDFRNDSVDAAEMAAEEAGVAMYQVETLPDGEGDVGSVSVRFQDMATGEMVEKRWTIPYEKNTARLDEAAPSMKLAASAAFLGEKLKGGPIGDLVELEELSAVSRSLQPVYTSSERVGQLIEMIEKARSMTR